MLKREAFDKAAKILGLPYPGGPLIDRYAQKGNATAFSFPDTDMPGLDFSFSGIKTAFLYFIRDKKLDSPGFVEENLHYICASIQDALINMLLCKLKMAVRETGIKEVAIAGGVSANSALRALLLSTGKIDNWRIHIPALAYCTDNAAMIAVAGSYKYEAGLFSNQQVTAIARWAIGQH